MGLQSGKTTATGDIYDSQRSLSGARSPFGEDSPDALRRRAELLLDEMMLCAVDGGGNNGSALQPQAEAHFSAPIDYDAHAPAQGGPLDDAPYSTPPYGAYLDSAHCWLRHGPQWRV